MTPTARPRPIRRLAVAALAVALGLAGALGTGTAAFAEEEAEGAAVATVAPTEPTPAAEDAAEETPTSVEPPTSVETQAPVETPVAEESAQEVVAAQPAAPEARALALGATSTTVEHIGKEYTATTGTTPRTVTYYVPENVVAGQSIHVSGSGWGASTVVSIKISKGTATEFVKPTVLRTNPATGTPYAEAQAVWGAAQADADGEWEADLEWPTAGNSDYPWSIGETHQLRFLAAGGMSVAAPVQTVAENSTITRTGTKYTVAPNDTTQGYPTAYYYLSDPIAGQAIHITGEGWKNQAGTAGSVVAFKLSNSVTGAVTPTADVVNPVGGAVQSKAKAIYAIVQAAANGEWTVDLPWPTLANADKEWSDDGTFTIQLLTGSLLTGDVARGSAASFSLVADPTAPPIWSHYALSASGATVWVESAVAAGDTSTIRIKGTGWLNADQSAPSTVAIKLNGGAYTRSGGAILEKPGAAEGTTDATIWALGLAADPAGRDNVFIVDANGDFEATLDAPTGLVAGQELTVRVSSTNLVAGDVGRNLTSQSLVVGGVPYVPPTTDPGVTCVPSTATPTVTVSNSAVFALGGVVHVTGTGWCHPGEGKGGSVIGIKLDEGAISHLDTSVHTNKTIWAIVEADAATGDWELDLQLPDGTTATSSPAFQNGVHTLRLLTGSLKTGDTSRTVLSNEFVVGAYQPLAIPDPPEAIDDLTEAARGGVAIAAAADSLVVTIPGAVAGDWIYVNAYAGASPRFPWGQTWFRADASGRVTVPLAGVTLPVGTNKVSVQSGNAGEFGRILGWGELTIAAPATQTTVTRTLPVLATTIAAQAPSTVPAAPFATDEGFTAENAGGAQAVQDGSIVTITLPNANPGDWVYVYAYSSPIPVGWIQVDANRQIRIDISALPAGDHHLAAIGEDGGVVGWVAATVEGETVGEERETAVVTSAGGSAEEVLEIDAPAVGPSATDWWLIGGAAALVAAMIAVVAIVRARRAGTAA